MENKEEKIKERKEFGIEFWTIMLSQCHFIIHIASWLIFLLCLLHFLILYKKLPDELGVHFGGNGEFDVYASKRFGFYPYLITLIALIFIFIAIRIADSKKTKLGLSLTEAGERLFRGIIILALDVSGLLITVIFSYYWSRSVENQVPLPLDEGFRTVLVATVIGVPAVTLLLLLVTSIVFRTKKAKT